MNSDEVRQKAREDANGTNTGGYAVGGGYGQSAMCDPSNSRILGNSAHHSEYLEEYSNTMRQRNKRRNG